MSCFNLSSPVINDLNGLFARYWWGIVVLKDAFIGSLGRAFVCLRLIVGWGLKI